MQHLSDDPDLGSIRFLKQLKKWKGPKKHKTKNIKKESGTEMDVDPKPKKTKKTVYLSESDSDSVSYPPEPQVDLENLFQNGDLMPDEESLKIEDLLGKEEQVPIQKIPKQILNENGRLSCYLCNKSFPKKKMDDLISHMEKHQVNFLCSLNEEERNILRISSFLNQMRVRAAIEECCFESEAEELKKIRGMPSRVSLKRKLPPKNHTIKKKIKLHHNE
eukprot:TRINITY_DN6419_c0_g1_i1.p1 TRINITY_DN6419_c0_g1~~TRINITY_DN6419_c0_g1_i1.p1  ORF type:complete len:219 (-),score=46.45 TRINITY_DN6419_c0_g1_i1:5-661(-)